MNSFPITVLSCPFVNTCRTLERQTTSDSEVR